MKKNTDFLAYFLLFPASVWSRPPGPPAVPGVFGIQLSQEKFRFYHFSQNLQFYTISTFFISEPSFAIYYLLPQHGRIGLNQF